MKLRFERNFSHHRTMKMIMSRIFFFLKYADMRTWTETRELSDLGEKMRNASN